MSGRGGASNKLAKSEEHQVWWKKNTYLEEDSSHEWEDSITS
jgi:hypothetical protein